MADQVEHRGYGLRAAPIQLAEGGWNHDGYIVEHTGPSVRETKFSGTGSSRTRKQAIETIQAMLRRKVDEWLD